MLSRFRELVEGRFEERLRQLTPEFKRKEFSTEQPEGPTFAWIPSQKLAFCLTLVVNAHTQTMDLFFAFMKDPCLSPVFARIGLPDDRPNKNGLRFSISQLWSPGAPGDWQLDLRGLFKVEGFEDLEAGALFSRSDAEEWYKGHPRLYTGNEDNEQRVVYPLVDHMLDKTVEYLMPYCRKIAERYHVTIADG